eukprot:TRINITY_DN2694_c0_g2_i2.p1 TRINITY_DN2694_c0_g2~~TRINITY_DN2694_c0_g2_i2.p1  ORF type:complete len:270 (-),score=94.81 TRINITY_DN2694_c0_g2_i2:27-791(-)
MASEEISESDNINDNFPTFFPPLNSQRYYFVKTIMEKYGFNKLCDLGCNKGKLLSYLSRDTELTLLEGVDNDEEILEEANKICQPLLFDLIVKRKKGLIINLYKGSIIQVDKRLYNHEFVSCIEVIEHLNMDILNCFEDALFSIWNPKIIVISTPNKEFNQLWNMQDNEFRHSDHKFEWTRSEFNNWCNSICQRYSYYVKIDGVGIAKNRLDVGFCTQIAVFERISNKKFNDCNEIYELKYQIKFPIAVNDKLN